jgi:hypothetical protein
MEHEGMENTYHTSYQWNIHRIDRKDLGARSEASKILTSEKTTAKGSNKNNWEIDGILVDLSLHEQSRIAVGNDSKRFISATCLSRVRLG